MEMIQYQTHCQYIIYLLVYRDLMALIHKIIKGGSDFFKSIKSDNRKELLELERLEKKIDEQQKQDKKPNMKPFVFTNRMFVKFWGLGILIVFLGLFVYQSLSIIYLIFMAYIVALAIEAIIGLIQQKIKHRGISIALAYLFIVVIFLGAMVFIIPFILSQFSDIITMMISSVSHFQQTLATKSLIGVIQDIHRLPGALKKALLDSFSNPAVVSGVQSQIEQNISQIVNLGTSYARNIGTMAVSAVGTFVSFLTQTSIVLTLAVLFSIQKDAVMKFIAGLGGDDGKYKYIFMKLERIYKKLGIWLRSQFLLCLFIGAAMYLALRIISMFGIDLPQKGALAGIAAMTEFIPYVGPIIGGIAAAMVAFIHFGMSGALVVIGAVLFIQRLENNILIPLLMNKTLGVNPVVIFISMIIGALILGVIGVLLAVPIAVIITLIMEKTFEE
ncbi:MAG: AI-2E family transporter [candidate division SR1 bacterium]|nr:AI-2E family transporter [candidate division SR1 bacterium]